MTKTSPSSNISTDVNKCEIFSTSAVLGEDPSYTTANTNSRTRLKTAPVMRNNKALGYLLEFQKDDSTKISFQNINGLELFTTSNNPLELCNKIQDHTIDIVCIV